MLPSDMLLPTDFHMETVKPNSEEMSLGYTAPPGGERHGS